MHRFYAAPGMVGDLVPLEPDEIAHARRVLRLRDGQEIEILDGIGHRYLAVLSGDGARLQGELPGNQPQIQVTLYQGVTKADKMDAIVQKCVELGVHRVVPVHLSRCVTRIPADDAPKRAARWSRIAREAAKQSARAYAPPVSIPMDWPQTLAELQSYETCLVPWEDSITPFLPAATAAGCRVALLVGPEGGIAPEEIAALPPAAVPVTLGPRILRAETAGMAALAALMCISGEWNR